MNWLRDTIAGRTIIVLVLGLGSILALAQFLYQAGLEREVTASNAESVVERLLLLSDTIIAIDPAKRDDAAHRLSGGPLELHWGLQPLAITGGSLDPIALQLRERLIVRLPPPRALGLIMGTSRVEGSTHTIGPAGNDGHTTLISLPLSDGSWLNVTLAKVQSTRASTPSALLSAMLGGLGVVLVSVLMSRWLTQPLEQLASGARQLFLTPRNASLPETGTREVRTLATAINDLQKRIRRLIDDRTQMLAAVSHDLRTPLTRLRLRIAGLADDHVRRSIEADLDEMEAMIDATLAFLRDDAVDEHVEQVDLAAILETIAADATDAGQSVDVQTPRHMVMAGRHLALKRALTNLIQNAVKYGGSASVSASFDRADVHIIIQDNGPGIPVDKMEAVFEPFYRLEHSRGRGTGGHGLGLAVARSIVRAHGGNIILSNRASGGLEARVVLPRAPLPA